MTLLTKDQNLLGRVLLRYDTLKAEKLIVWLNVCLSVLVSYIHFADFNLEEEYLL